MGKWEKSYAKEEQDNKMGSVNGHAGRAQVNLLTEGRSATNHGLVIPTGIVCPRKEMVAIASPGTLRKLDNGCSDIQGM